MTLGGEPRQGGGPLTVRGPASALKNTVGFLQHIQALVGAVDMRNAAITPSVPGRLLLHALGCLPALSRGDPGGSPNAGGKRVAAVPRAPFSFGVVEEWTESSRRCRLKRAQHCLNKSRDRRHDLARERQHVAAL